MDNEDIPQLVKALKALIKADKALETANTSLAELHLSPDLTSPIKQLCDQLVRRVIEIRDR